MAYAKGGIPLSKPFRWVEMVLSAVVLGLLADIGSHLSLIPPLGVMYVAFGGLLLVTLVDVVVQLTKDPISDLPMFIFCLTGCALFLTSGTMSTVLFIKVKSHLNEQKTDVLEKLDPEMVHQFKKTSSEILATAVLAIINGMVFLADALLIFRRRNSVMPKDRMDVEKLNKKPIPIEVEEKLHRASFHTVYGVQVGRKGGGRRDLIVCPDHGDNCVCVLRERSAQLPGTPLPTEVHDEAPRARRSHSGRRKSQKGNPVRSQRRTVTRVVVCPEIRHGPNCVCVLEDDGSGYTSETSHSSERYQGGPTRKRRSGGRKCCRILIWKRERIISVFFKVLESALGIACFCVFVTKIWRQETPFISAFTFCGIAAATALAITLVVNSIAKNPPHRTAFLLAAVIGIVAYYTIAIIRFQSSKVLLTEMETPLLMTGAVSLVDAALCLATFINMDSSNTGEEQPQRPDRRSPKTPKTMSDSSSGVPVKKQKKQTLFDRAKKHFKKSSTM